MRLEKNGDGFCIDAPLLAELLDIPPSRIHELMRNQEITSTFERGEQEHSGKYRLTFFSRSRRVRLEVDESGEVVRRSVVDFRDRPLPAALHLPEGRS